MRRNDFEGTFESCKTWSTRRTIVFVVNETRAYFFQTRILLSLWDPGLVEEALNFIEDNKVNKLCKDEHSELEEVSPLKKIAQQISLTAKRSNYDDLMTPDETPSQQNIWNNLLPSSKFNGCSLDSPDCKDHILNFVTAENEEKYKDENSNVQPKTSDSENAQSEGITNQNTETSKMFLDTHAMCSSPSANYYKPTDEPEPWDLTQLNIEASVMCLVSKVKFLCGKCSSPSVRLRSQKTISRSQNSFKRDAKLQVDSFVHVCIWRR